MDQIRIGCIMHQQDQWGNRKLGEKWRKQEKMGKCVTGNLKKRMSRAFATCANKPKVSFEQSKSCKMKKNGKFSEQM